MGRERGKVRQVGGARQEFEHAGANGFRIGRCGQAEPQDLRRDRELAAALRNELGVFALSRPEPRRLFQRSRRRSIESTRHRCGMHELQILRDEFDIDRDAPAAYLRSQNVGIALCPRRWPPRISTTSAATVRALRLRHRRVADRCLDLGEKPGAAEHRPGAGQRHMLPRPGLALLVALKPSICVATGPDRPDGRSRMSTGVEASSSFAPSMR